MAARFAYRRFWEIDRQIRKKAYPTIRKLAEFFEVTERTVHRDLEYLKDQLGAPIEYDRKRKGYFYTDPSYFLPALDFTEGELLSFFIAERALRDLSGSPFEKPIRTALEKIAAFLPEKVTVNLQDFCTFCTFDSGPQRRVETEIFDRLAKAVKNKSQVRILYHSFSGNETSRRTVDPYHLANSRGDWYLIAFCHRRKEMRMFAVTRIRECAPSGKAFKVLPGFDVNDYLKDKLEIEVTPEKHDFSIRFDPWEARWIRERVWHESERKEEQPDGSLILYLSTCSVGEIRRWILSLGCHAEVLAPAWLRKELGEETQKMLLNYK